MLLVETGQEPHNRVRSPDSGVIKVPKSLKSSKRIGVAQGDLFGTGRSLQTCVIRRRSDFEGLFDGFHKMRAVSYVVSPELLLDFFDKHGYTEIEVVVGENLSAATDYKKELERKGLEVTERLADLVDKGSLRVLVPDRTIHTKFYILDGDGVARIIQTSANLTETAREASRQVNYAWYLDLHQEDPLLARLLDDYQSHLQGCSLFMDDLKNLLGERQDVERRQVIEAWLKGGVVDEQDMEMKRVFQELTAKLAQVSDGQEEPLISFRLPESPKARQRTERLLAQMNPVGTAHNQIGVTGKAFIRYVNETHHVPVLLLNLERRILLLGIGGSLKTLTEPPPNPEVVNKALQHIEAYISTVDSAESTDRLYAKSSMFEALLYVFFSPFANEYMKAKRARYGMVDTRGPRFLYIYGPSHNGKTTFLRFAIRLLTGSVVEPMSRQDFTRTRILNAALIGTAFPLVFDDVNPSTTSGLEDVFKSYWERGWQEQYVSPQIIVASNTPRLKEWAKSRVKRVDFDVHFAPTASDKEKLNRLFTADNALFKWFSYLYFSHLNESEPQGDDELQFARVVFRELYGHAQRPLPQFFPNEPIETLYDPGRKDWRDLLYVLDKVARRSEGNRTLITFKPDVQYWEVRDYEGYLPQTIKYQRRGNTLIIENPDAFEKWVGRPPQHGGWLTRLLNRRS